MKRILILTADYGYGHRSAAKAITQALQELYGKDCQVDIVNPMDHPRAPAALRDGANNYDRMVREAPELYKITFKVGDTPAVSGIVKNSLTLMLINAIREIIHQKQPDVIVCTYSSYQNSLATIFELEKINIPVLTIVTDQPIVFLGAGVPSAKPKAGYDFAVVDLEVDASGKGTGTFAPAAKITVKQGAFVVEDYSAELVRLTDISKSK